MNVLQLQLLKSRKVYFMWNLKLCCGYLSWGDSLSLSSPPSRFKVSREGFVQEGRRRKGEYITITCFWRIMYYLKHQCTQTAKPGHAIWKQIQLCSFHQTPEPPESLCLPLPHLWRLDSLVSITSAQPYSLMCIWNTCISMQYAGARLHGAAI